MNDYVAKITLDLNCQATPIVISAGQYDIGRQIKINLTADGEAYDATGATAVCKGKSGSNYFAVNATVAKNIVTVPTDKAMLSSAGRTVAKIVLTDGTRTYSTQPFVINTHSDYDGDITTSDYYPELLDILSRVIALTESGAVLTDTALDAKSVNPVQNKVLTAIINNKANKDDIGDRNITLDFNYDGYIDKKGKFNTLASFKTTDFIAISSRVIVKGEFRDLNSPLYYINCYDSNKNYLGGIINATSSGNKIVNVNGVVTLIEGTCFIRVTNSLKSISMVKMEYSLNDTGDLSSINQKAVTTEKLAEDVTNQLSKLKDDIGDRNITLDFNYDGYIDKKGKFNTLASFKTTDFIAISSRVIVKGEFRDLNSPLYYINCYDSNKNYLGGIINATSSGNKIVNVNGVVTLIEGTCFIRVTNSRRSISMVKMGYSLSDTGDLSSVNQKIEESKTNNSIYSNIINDGLGFSVFSKFASVGDSLSVGYNTEKDGTPISEDLKHSWGAYIEKRCGTKSFWTGKSGQTCKTWLNTTSETWGLNYCKSIGTMPLYVICMGANESGINIGTTDDIDTDNDTLYGYVSKVINELRNISPKSYIVCTGVSREQNSPSINDVYKTICELKEKCYYLDCFKEFNSEPFTSYFFNWHYSANGYSAMANLFDYKLKEVMAKNVEDFKYVNEADN